MSRALAIVFVLACASGYADEPATTAERLARFAVAGCDYLHANGWDVKARRPTLDSKLAPHFGRILKKEPNAVAFDYRLRVPGFADWDVIFSTGLVTLRPPDSVSLTLRDLERVLGPSDVPEGDNAKPGASVAGAVQSSELLEFARPAGHQLCVIQAMIDRNGADAGASRVRAFRFSD